MVNHLGGGQDALEMASAAQRGPDIEGVPAGAKIRNLRLIEEEQNL